MHIIVRHPQDLEAPFLEIFRPPGILFTDIPLIVDVAVDLDDQTRRQAAEIDHERPDPVLPPDPERVVPEPGPERCLGRGRIAA